MPTYDHTLFDPPAPLASVAIRNSESGASLSDVLMVIDSGADVTLIPQASVDTLGLLINPEEEYELMGFDGNISFARIVQIDLIFLRRIFRGRFLVTKQEVGVLGRDILNHVSLLLDGPHSTWSEHQTSEKI
jgi:hypothetical protein